MKIGVTTTPAKVAFAAVTTLFLSGCFENHRSTAKLCEDNPQICYQLNVRDGQCRHERTDLIWQRNKVSKKPSELNRFDELLLTKEYAKCMELAAQIETTTLKEKKTLRTEALFHAYDSIEKIEQELKSSYQPSIIYYRWTQGDNEALEQFLKLEETNYLDTPEMQLGLATYYVDRDKVHTIKLLMKALSYYDGRDGDTREKTIPNVVKSLATANHSLNNLDTAYMWALVGGELGLSIAKEAQLKLLYPMSDSRRAQIAAIAENVASEIDDGDFSPGLLDPLLTLSNNPD